MVIKPQKKRTKEEKKKKDLQNKPKTIKKMAIGTYISIITLNVNELRDFPGGAVVKNPPANAGDVGSSPGLGRSHMLQSN